MRGYASPADLNGRIAMIQTLIPMGSPAVEEALQQEVEHLAGSRYGRQGGRAALRRGVRTCVTGSSE